MHGRECACTGVQGGTGIGIGRWRGQLELLARNRDGDKRNAVVRVTKTWNCNGIPAFTLIPSVSLPLIPSPTA